ncbi:MAG: Methylmalonyl-CoA epimerase [Acidobacteria bacterium]|nr:Methylmalonyl-CoA epimerase [Acidobacteriota bacterium]
MKAVLDHVGIAVKDLAAALAFYRDALGLEIEAPEEVASQRVRAHFLPVGDAKLELLEATAPDSPIAKYTEKRGPGLHHITLRVDDIDAALAQLKARGTRLIDDQPRQGAEHSLVAFIHPASAHGVLVELKQSANRQSAASTVPLAVSRYAVGDLELISLSDGLIRLDGGAMFGTVPKVLWEKKAPADARNRIAMAMRPLLVRGARTMLIDAGVGDKDAAKFHDIFGIDRTRSLSVTMAEAGVAPEDVDIVLASHLHFDHAGGFTYRDAGGRIRPTFPRAQYIVRRGEWEDATHPHARNRASYLADNYAPLADAGVLQLVDDDATIMPGVKVRRTGGHCMHHQMVLIESKGRTAAFVADLIPTTAHLPDAWIMGFDLYPMDTLAVKQQFLKQAIEQDTLVFFEHDPALAAGYIREQNGTRFVQPAS